MPKHHTWWRVLLGEGWLRRRRDRSGLGVERLEPRQMLAVDPIGGWACTEGFSALPETGYFEIAFNPDSSKDSNERYNSYYCEDRFVDIGQLTEEVGRMFELGGDDGSGLDDDIPLFP